MARTQRSHVHKRRRGCLSGCLTRIVLLLGLCALLFVAACVLGFVKNDPVTGKPELAIENISIDALQNINLDALQNIDLGALQNISLPDSLASLDLSDAAALVQGVKLPAWASGISPVGLTVKTLRAGEGEAVLVCADGYTMLVGGGDGTGIGLCAQLLVSGVRHLSAVVATSSGQQQIGGLPLMMRLMPPDYLIYQDSQVKGSAYNRMMETAQKMPAIQLISPKAGLTFSLGRGTVTVIGPVRTPHKDERDDGLTIRVDYGATSVLIAGSITQNGERELISSRVRLAADALICGRGGSEEATCTEFVTAVSPKIALLTGKEPDNSVKVRLARIGADVYTVKEHGTVTLYSDGQTMAVKK